MFDKPLEIAVVRNTPSGAYRYSRVRVIPATVMYYEAEDFIEFTGNWTDVGTGQGGEQNEDRPGADVLDMNSVYGYDSQYASGTTYSLEKAKKITVQKGDKPEAQFTFTGTGFDILAMTNSDTGMMVVRVYQGDTADPNLLAASWMVNTYYGCSREEIGFKRCLYVRADKDSEWTLSEETAFPTMTAADHWAHIPIDWAHIPIDWALTHHITAGISHTTFGPGAGCTRAQAVMLLRRAKGSPEPQSENNPFRDVPEDAYYHPGKVVSISRFRRNGIFKGIQGGASCLFRNHIV